MATRTGIIPFQDIVSIAWQAIAVGMLAVACTQVAVQTEDCTLAKSVAVGNFESTVVGGLGVPDPHVVHFPKPMLPILAVEFGSSVALRNGLGGVGVEGRSCGVPRPFLLCNVVAA